MVESLLNTSNVPPELNQFIQEKIEGNPFYLEELVNSLIETGTLVVDDTGWHLTRTIAESEISSTIHGVIAARLDRLKNETKRVLQEASVIGRAFYFDILKRVTDLSENIEQHLSGLERLDLIKTKSFEPDLEYIFKHALTQEVVYNGLLIKERLKIHARIAHVIEKLFADRLPEFYETLAFHYKQSNSVLEAVDYLMKAGEKSLKRYAVQEAHEYYNDAYRLMIDNPAHRKDNRDLFYHLLNKWSLVYYYLGDFKEQTGLLKLHQPEAEEINSPEIKAMFYGWLGWALMFRKELEDSFRKHCPSVLK
jgi:predicted ATPase